MTTEPIAVFLTAGMQRTSVYAADNGYSVGCTGCGWTAGPDRVPRFSDDAHVLELPFGEQKLRVAENFAERHAAGCRKLPRDAWPQRETQLPGGESR